MKLDNVPSFLLQSGCWFLPDQPDHSRVTAWGQASFNCSPCILGSYFMCPFSGLMWETNTFFSFACFYKNSCVLPEVFSVIKVPRWCMTHHLATIWRLLQHGLVPEFLRHWFQTKRSEKLVWLLEHSGGVPVLRKEKRHFDWIKGSFCCLSLILHSLYVSVGSQLMFIHLFHHGWSSIDLCGIWVGND